jgi:hypothetical protein
MSAHSRIVMLALGRAGLDRRPAEAVNDGMLPFLDPNGRCR